MHRSTIFEHSREFLSLEKSYYDLPASYYDLVERLKETCS